MACIPTYLHTYLHEYGLAYMHIACRKGDTEIQTDRQTDGRTDGQTDMPGWQWMDASMVACVHTCIVTQTQTHVHVACMSAWQPRAGVESRGSACVCTTAGKMMRLAPAVLKVSFSGGISDPLLVFQVIPWCSQWSGALSDPLSGVWSDPQTKYV